MEYRGEKIFCIDTSIFVWINRYYNIPHCWELLEHLFKSNKIVSHIYVFEELTNQSKKPDFVSKWLNPKKENFSGITKRQTELVSQILEKFPLLISAKNEKNQADPWLVALAIEITENINIYDPQQKMMFEEVQRLRPQIVVVSSEKKEHPHRIPAVCGHFGIGHIDIIEFFEENGFTLGLVPKET